MRDLTQHLTTRADDSHAAPVHRPRREGDFHHRSCTCQTQVGFFALRRIKPHAPPLVRAPVNSFEFQPCDRTHRRGTYCVSAGTDGIKTAGTSAHRLQRGLPGYLILFAPHAVAPQCQNWSSWPPSPRVFSPISTHFTATQGIPPAPPSLKSCSFYRQNTVEPYAFTVDIQNHLRALYAQ